MLMCAAAGTRQHGEVGGESEERRRRRRGSGGAPRTGRCAQGGPRLGDAGGEVNGGQRGLTVVAGAAESGGGCRQKAPIAAQLGRGREGEKRGKGEEAAGHPGLALNRLGEGHISSL